jgi:hypothetical protein
MDNGRALLAGAVVVAAALWWFGGHPGYETPAQRQARIEAIDKQRGTPGGRTLYRCPGADGVNLLTDNPPPGRKCTPVHIRDDQNVVSLEGDAQPPVAKPPDKKR